LVLLLLLLLLLVLLMLLLGFLRSWGGDSIASMAGPAAAATAWDICLPLALSKVLPAGTHIANDDESRHVSEMSYLLLQTHLQLVVC
jgi:hypothetical protein